jgi:hypothetical protein
MMLREDGRKEERERRKEKKKEEGKMWKCFQTRKILGINIKENL